ncbi:hypothetical protein KI387_039051, partial [Taxus chinensis]
IAMHGSRGVRIVHSSQEKRDLQPFHYIQSQLTSHSCNGFWNFIGVINPNSSQGHKWILTATDYFTRWTEAVALKEANESSILDFYEGITTRFGVPATIISDNALAFIGSK